jgi:Thiamin pyrophosphokinase, vitamin B1 binding domain
MLAVAYGHAWADCLHFCGRHAEQLKMQFGGLISTSNTLVSDTVHVQSDLPLLWTTEFDDRP